MADTLVRLEREIHGCRACSRLVEWRERVSREKKASLRDCEYWGKPVPSFGGPERRGAPVTLLVVGLAPGAHGANRTGRPFTGDGAGPFLYAALHRAGFASAPESLHRDDGLQLVGARITNVVRCVPPGNKPTPEELDTCAPFLERELALLPDLEVALCLGQLAWRAMLRALASSGIELPRPLPKFGHGSEADLGQGAPRLIGSYHPSQLNTRTGRLTRPMFDRVLRRIRSRAGRS